VCHDDDDDAAEGSDRAYGSKLLAVQSGVDSIA
jgi:hypothetical protein